MIESLPMDHEPVEEEKILFSINPQKLLNRKLLFTTQDWIDDLKMEAALEGKDIPPIESNPIMDIWYLPSGKPVYVMRDGNHRTGIACIKKQEIVVELNGIYYGDSYPKKVFGFNIITQKLRGNLGSDCEYC